MYNITDVYITEVPTFSLSRDIFSGLRGPSEFLSGYDFFYNVTVRTYIVQYQVNKFDIFLCDKYKNITKI